MKLYKYQGAGNDFLIADNRDGHISEKDGILTIQNPDGTVCRRVISDLCDRRYGVGADGLMLLDSSHAYSFSMKYFNSWLLWDTPAGRGQAQPIAGTAWTQVQQIRTTPESKKPAPVHR